MSSETMNSPVMYISNWKSNIKFIINNYRTMNEQIIILAAGKGSRMKSELPKVMHEVGGKPMVQRVIDSCSKITDDLILVYSDHIKEFVPLLEGCKLAEQKSQLGTAHAVDAASEYMRDDKNIGVIYGDNPLITDDIISKLFAFMNQRKASVVTLAFEYDKENQYGRIVVDQNGNFVKIVEAKFASDEELKITICNSGIMVFAPGILQKYLPQCLKPDSNNPEKELYLTDIIEVCFEAGEKVDYYIPDDSENVIGVNTKDELDYANNLVSKKEANLS